MKTKSIVSKTIEMSDEDLLSSAIKLTSDAKFSVNDTKSAIAALSFILIASGKFTVEIYSS